MFQQTPQKRVLFPRTLTPVMVGGFLACLVLFTIFLSIWGNQTANAATNSTINFQARLENANGSIAPDGNYFIEFNLYTASSGGSSIWTERYQGSSYSCPFGSSTGASNNKITVKNGYLSANLGSLCTFPSTINWDQNLWITMNVGGSGVSASWDGEMNPRLALTSVPYAFRAGQLATFNSGNGFTSSLSIIQPTSGSQVFQIPDQGVAGTFNLCIANSSACGFALSSGNTNYIQNQNASAQTSSNFWISGTGHADTFKADTVLQAPTIDAATASTTLNIGATSGGNANAISLNQNVTVASGVSFTANGPAVFQGNVTSTQAFQVLTPTSTPLIAVDTTTSNLVTNSSFEANITNWSAKVPTAGGGSSTLSQTSAQSYQGYDSLQAITATAGGYGVQTSTFTSALTASQPYELTFMARCSSSISTFTWGHQDQSGGTANDLNNTTGTCDTNWRRFALNFTPTGTLSSPNIYMTTGTSTGITFWIDAVQLVPTATNSALPYSAGSVKIDGVITDAVVIRQPTNSTNSFEVENAAGTGNNFVVDTVNSQIRINTTGYGANLNVGGTSIFRTTSNNASGFQIQDSSGWQLLNVDTTLPAANMISNPGIETATTTWANKGSGALTFTSTAANVYDGNGAGSLNMTAANGGTSFPLTLNLGTAYNFSFYAKASGSNVSNINFGYTNTGGDNDCVTNATVVTGGFTRYTCSFTVTTTAGTAIYIKENSLANETIFIDDAQVLASATAPVPFSMGNVGIRGTVNGPLALRNNNDSTTAFQIQNAAGTSNLFVADTLNNQININGVINTTGTVNFNQNAADQLKVTALQVPTTDMSVISNSGFPITTAGINAQQLDYYAALNTASAEASSQRINITNTSSTASTVTDGVRIVVNSSTATGSTNALKIDNITAGSGTETAINLGTGYDNLLSYNGTQLINGTGILQSAALSGTYGNITGTGALGAGSIGGSFGTISTGNTITGTTLNGTTGINTGAGAGTQRIDASGNLSNIGTIGASGNITTTALLQGGSLSAGSGNFQVSSSGVVTNFILPIGQEAGSVYLTGFATNELTNYDLRGGTIATAVTGGATISNPNNIVHPGSGDTASIVTLSAAGTAQWQLTGVNVPVDSRAKWTPYLQMRTGQMPSEVKVEYRRSDGVTWDVIVDDTTPVFSGNLWLGPLDATYANYPITGYRITLSYTTTATSYVREIGLMNHNTPLGAYNFASLGSANTFNGNINIANSGNLQIGGSTVITSSSVLQGVTANTSILNAGQLGVARGGTGVDGSSAANGTLLIGNGSGYTLSTLTAGTGISIDNSSAGHITINGTGAAGSAGGDLTGSYPNPTIAKLQGGTLTITSVASNNILQYNGSAWVNTTISGDITITGGVAAISSGVIVDGDLSTGTFTHITGTGALSAGSIGGSFGTINNGSNSITTTGTLSGGTLNVGGTQRIDASGNLSNIGTIGASGKITTTGDLTTGNQNIISFTRTVPTTVNNEVDLGSFAFTQGTANLYIDVTVPSSSFTVSKQYTIPVFNNATANVWQLIQPTSDSGPSGGNDVSLEINVNGTTASLRLRRSVGTTAGTAYITIRQQGVVGDVFTASSATSSVSAPTVYYGPSIAGGSAGTYTIQGNLTVANSGGLTIGGQSVITSGLILQHVTTDASILTSGTINTARISGSYTGITGVGTLTAGTWNASVIGAQYGGTGLATATTNGILYGNGTSAMGVTAAGTSGQILQANGSGVPGFVTFSQDVTVAAGGAVTIANGAVTGTKIANTTITNTNLASGSFGAITGVGTLGTLTVSGSAGNITVGNLTTSYTIGIGTGTIASGNTGTITIGNSATGTGISAVTVGSTNATSTLLLQGGTNSSAIGLMAGSGGTIALGASGATANNITVGQSTVSNTISIGGAAVTGTQTINIGNAATGAGNAVITIGSTNDGSSLALQSGTGGVVVTANTATNAFQVQSSTGAFLTADATKSIITTNDVMIGSPLTMNSANTGRIFTTSFENESPFGSGSAGSGTISQVTSPVRLGKYAEQLSMTSANAYLWDTVAANPTLYGRAYFNVSTLGNPTYLMAYHTTSGAFIYVDLGTSGNLCYGSNLTGSTLSACSTTAPSTGAWHELEVAVGNGTSTGFLQVYLDGTLVTSNSNAINLSAQNFGTNNFNEFELGYTAGNNLTATITFDDVALDTVDTGKSSSLVVADSLIVNGSSSIQAGLTVNGTIAGSDPSIGYGLSATNSINTEGIYYSQDTAGLSSDCSNNQGMINLTVTGGIVTGGTCGNAASTLQDAYNNTSQSTGGTSSTPAFIREGTGSIPSGTSGSATVASTTSGHFLVAIIGTGGGSTNKTVTSISGGSGTWKYGTTGPGGSTGTHTELWYCYTCNTSTSVTATVNFNQSTGAAVIHLSEYSGVMTSADPLETIAGGTGSTPASNTQVTPTITTTNANDLLVAGFSIYNSSVGSATTPSGFTAMTPFLSGSKRMWEDYNASVPAGSYSATWVENASTSSAGVLIAAFKPSVSGGSTVASILLTDAKDYIITAPDTATDPNILVNLQCRTGCSTSQGRWAVQSNGTDALSVLYDTGASITNVNIGSNSTLKLSADVTGLTRSVITHDFTCTSSETVNHIVSLSGTTSVSVPSGAADPNVIGVVVAKPSTTMCTVAIEGIVQIQSTSGATVTLNALVQSLDTSGNGRTLASPGNGTVIGKAITTKDGSNMFWAVLSHG